MSLFFSVLGTELRALHLPGKRTSTELNLQPLNITFKSKKFLGMMALTCIHDLSGLRQEDGKFEASLDYISRPCF
jgi:hypothetical protein